MAAVVVDFKAGYHYDIEVDVQAIGADVGQVIPGRQHYGITVQLSPDNGATWPVQLAQDVWTYDAVAHGRLHVLFDALGPYDSDYNLVRVTAQSVAPAAASLLYSPSLCVFDAQEYSPVV
jgi:hypothetical protein